MFGRAKFNGRLKRKQAVSGPRQHGYLTNAEGYFPRISAPIGRPSAEVPEPMIHLLWEHSSTGIEPPGHHSHKSADDVLDRKFARRVLRQGRTAHVARFSRTHSTSIRRIRSRLTRPPRFRLSARYCGRCSCARPNIVRLKLTGHPYRPSAASGCRVGCPPVATAAVRSAQLAATTTATVELRPPDLELAVHAGAGLLVLLAPVALADM